MSLSWFWGFAVVFCNAAGAFGEESGPTRLNGAEGESVTFAPVVPRGSRVDSVVWNGNSTIAIVTPGEPAPLRVIHTRYRDRLRVPDGSYSLQVTDLRPEDTGTYTAQIATQGSPDPIFRRFALRVYKKLAESDITATPVLGSLSIMNEICNITLNCTVQGAGEDVNCTWNHTDSTVNSTSIHISHRLGDEGASVTCTARNPVSSSSKSISLKEVCAASSAQSGDSGLSAGVIVLIVVCAGAAVGGVLYQRKRRRDKQTLTPGAADSAGADGENHTVYAKVGNFPLGTQNRGPQTTEETTKTIYSTVHLPSQ
nr:SLAM family member 5-like [Pelodiscus sinensis]|eukprot:XP_025043687.1 SLAM family member 5-like [Pelodiscus sinensis]